MKQPTQETEVRSDEERLRIVAAIDQDRREGTPIKAACSTYGISDASYYTWRKTLAKDARIDMKSGIALIENTGNGNRAHAGGDESELEKLRAENEKLRGENNKLRSLLGSMVVDDLLSKSK